MPSDPQAGQRQGLRGYATDQRHRSTTQPVNVVLPPSSTNAVSPLFQNTMRRSALA